MKLGLRLKIHSASYKKENSKCESNVSSSDRCKRQNPSGADFMILVLLILSILLIGLTSYIWNIVNHERLSIYSEKLEEFPVPCEELSLSPYEDSETFNVKKNGLKTSIGRNGQYMCSSFNLTKITKLVVERQSRLRLAQGFVEQRYFSCGNESLAPKSGYLTVAFTQISRYQNFSDEDIDVKLQWDKGQAESYADPSIQYHSGEITIPEGRTYFIYASAHFNLSSQGNGEKNRHFGRLYQLSVRICKNVHGYEHTLFGRTNFFNMSNGHATTSLRIGSHLQMSRNDKIYVKLTGAKRLMLHSKGNTFGLFPL